MAIKATDTFTTPSSPIRSKKAANRWSRCCTAATKSPTSKTPATTQPPSSNAELAAAADDDGGGARFEFARCSGGGGETFALLRDRRHVGDVAVVHFDVGRARVEGCAREMHRAVDVAHQVRIVQFGAARRQRERIARKPGRFERGFGRAGQSVLQLQPALGRFGVRLPR